MMHLSSNLMITKSRLHALFTPSIRKGIVTLGNQGIVSATNFLTGVIIARSCSKDEFGLYILGFSVVLLVMDLQISLIATPYMIYSPRLKGDALRLYNGSSLLHQLGLTSLLVLALAGWGGALLLGHGSLKLASVLWALTAVIGFIMLREFIRRFCFAHLRSEIAFFFDSCISVLQLGGLLILARSGMLSANRAYWVIGCACALVGLGWLFLNRGVFLPQIGHAITDFKTNWKFGKWVFASGLVWAISMNLYPWFLTFFHGTASAGVWGACLGVLAFANVPLVGMQNFVGPKISNVFAEGGMTALRGFVLKSSLFFCVSMSVMCCALFLGGDPLLVLLYGDKYAGSGLIVFILTLGLVPASVAFSFSRALFAVERADIDFKVNIVALFIMFSLGIWFVRSFGPIGAAAGLLVANIAASIVRWTSFNIISRPSPVSVPD